MRRIGLIVALGALLSMLAGVTTASPALADTGTRQLHLAATSMNLTSFTCLNANCSVGEAIFDGDASSNLSAGIGSFHADLHVDFLGQPAPGGNCNVVDEHDVFAFGNGTILIRSHHEDCATHGLRIDTTFTVTGRTDAFAGATGGGGEFSANSASPVGPIIFNGTITF